MALIWSSTAASKLINASNVCSPNLTSIMKFLSSSSLIFLNFYQDPKTKKTQAVKAAELAEDWEEEGEEEKGDEKVEKVEKVPETAEKTEEKSEKMAEADVDTTPVRKSGRAPKPTEKLLEGKQQVGF